uniref:Uncharacterized protein n=1 Tax=Oryza punctata TaxID=4537 RepID=A0A0E0KKI9_ORYPU
MAEQVVAAEKVLTKKQLRLRALAEKRVRLHLQHNMSDINKHSYRIFLNAGEDEFKELMRKRHQRMLQICSTTVDYYFFSFFLSFFPATPRAVLALVVSQIFITAYDASHLRTLRATRVLMTCCLMFSETQRFMQMQEEVLENIRNGQDRRINHLIALIHDWIVESRRRASTADQAEEEAAVVPAASAQQASSSTTSSCSAVVPAAAAQQASSSSSTPSGSVDYGLWLLKYENSCFLPLIERQQQQQHHHHHHHPQLRQRRSISR